MGEPRHRARLAQDPLAQLGRRGAAGATGPQHLERDHPVQLRVARGIDHPHPARANCPHDLVAADPALLRDLGCRLGESRARCLGEQLPAGLAALDVLLDLLFRGGREPALHEPDQVVRGNAAHCAANLPRRMRGRA